MPFHYLLFSTPPHSFQTLHTPVCLFESRLLAVSKTELGKRNYRESKRIILVVRIKSTSTCILLLRFLKPIDVLNLYILRKVYYINLCSWALKISVLWHRRFPMFSITLHQLPLSFKLIWQRVGILDYTAPVRMFCYLKSLTHKNINFIKVVFCPPMTFNPTISLWELEFKKSLLILIFVCLLRYYLLLLFMFIEVFIISLLLRYSKIYSF